MDGHVSISWMSPRGYGGNKNVILKIREYRGTEHPSVFVPAQRSTPETSCLPTCQKPLQETRALAESFQNNPHGLAFSAIAALSLKISSGFFYQQLVDFQSSTD